MLLFQAKYVKKGLPGKYSIQICSIRVTWKQMVEDILMLSQLKRAKRAEV